MMLHVKDTYKITIEDMCRNLLDCATSQIICGQDHSSDSLLKMKVLLSEYLADAEARGEQKIIDRMVS